jgi:RNA polymerase sigma factor (sigma-70 family)
MATPESSRDGEWARLMAAAQDGDAKSYERLLREIVPFVRTVAARRHGRRPDRLEDVVQDVLVTIHRVRHTYDPTRSFENWLATIAARRSIDALRRRSRVEAREIRDDLAYETFADAGANGEAEENLDRGLRAEGLRAAIATLPDSQREALELLKIREMSLIEAAEASGKSATALKVNVHRAIKSLRRRLKGDPA